MKILLVRKVLMCALAGLIAGVVACQLVWAAAILLIFNSGFLGNIFRALFGGNADLMWQVSSIVCNAALPLVGFFVAWRCWKHRPKQQPRAT